MSISINESLINEILGPPVDISGIENGANKNFTEVAFNLYREVASVTLLVASLFDSCEDKKDGFLHNRAIEVGLMIRIAKLMKSVLTLLCCRVSEHGEVIMILNRCIAESVIKLKYFCEKAIQQDFDNFIKSSLRPEKESYEQIKINIETRGKELPIEKRMLNSIEKTLRISGYSINDLDVIPRFKNYKEILRELEMESCYPFIQGIPSHATHGNWVDLLLHNLEEKNGRFKSRPESCKSDTRLICPINVVILDSVKSYFNKYFNQPKEMKFVLARISDLEARNIKVDNFHERSFKK